MAADLYTNMVLSDKEFKDGTKRIEGHAETLGKRLHSISSAIGFGKKILGGLGTLSVLRNVIGGVTEGWELNRKSVDGTISAYEEIRRQQGMLGRGLDDVFGNFFSKFEYEKFYSAEEAVKAFQGGLNALSLTFRNAKGEAIGDHVYSSFLAAAMERQNLVNQLALINKNGLMPPTWKEAMLQEIEDIYQLRLDKMKELGDRENAARIKNTDNLLESLKIRELRMTGFNDREADLRENALSIDNMIQSVQMNQDLDQATKDRVEREIRTIGTRQARLIENHADRATVVGPGHARRAGDVFAVGARQATPENVARIVGHTEEIMKATEATAKACLQIAARLAGSLVPVFGP